MTKRLITLLAVLVVVAISAATGPASSLVVPDVFSISRVATKGTMDSKTGGEPSIISAADGKLYVSFPSSAVGMGFYRSVNNGKNWLAGKVASPDTGDTTVDIDSTGAVYQSNLRGLPNVGDPNDPTAPLTDPSPLQIDLYKSLDGGATWPQVGVAGTSDSSTNSTFLVDRQWVGVYIPPGKTTNEARVYITYHDWVPGLVWVNVSKDGGKTFAPQQTIMTSPAALASGACNTIPGPAKVVQSGPHAGRVYATWLSSSPGIAQASGCNYTQMATFGQVWAAYSDDEGDTWTDTLVYDSGVIGHDASGLFADLTLDSAGNPYVAFALNDADAPHIGASDDQWNVFVSASFDGGKTWNGASDGTGTPFQVNSDSGTHVFPTITAGDPGNVAVAYIATGSVIPQLPYGKPMIGGDPEAKWDVFVSRSLNLMSGKPTWTTSQVTKKPMHTGDVCTLGIFCISDLGSDRSLLDFIDITGDPAGLVHVAYTDTEASEIGEIMVANQVAGASLRAPKKVASKPGIVLPKPQIRKPRVLGEKLAGTGVRDMTAIGVLLMVVAGLLVRRLRRTA